MKQKFKAIIEKVGKGSKLYLNDEFVKYVTDFSFSADCQGVSKISINLLPDEAAIIEGTPGTVELRIGGRVLSQDHKKQLYTLLKAEFEPQVSAS